MIEDVVEKYLNETSKIKSLSDISIPKAKAISTARRLIDKHSKLMERLKDK